MMLINQLIHSKAKSLWFFIFENEEGEIFQDPTRFLDIYKVMTCMCQACGAYIIRSLSALFNAMAGQFYPESIMTEHGHALLKFFFRRFLKIL